MFALSINNYDILRLHQVYHNYSLKENKYMKKWMVSTAITAGVLGVGTITALAANNHDDTTFSFNFKPSITGSTVYTSARSKYDASSAYMMAQSRSKTQSYTASVVNGSNGNFSQTWYVEIQSLNHGYYIPNNGYEDQGYGVSVKIKGHTGDLFGFHVDGVWSPDSV